MALINGKKMVYLFRPYANRTSSTGTILSFVTDNSRSVSANSDTTMTKDGPIRTPEDPDISISSSSYLPVGDTMIDTLEDAMLNNELVECWQANLDEPVSGQEGKYKGIYYQGYITDLEVSSPADDFVQIDIDFTANGKGARGEVTVTAEQQETADYVFADTTQATAVNDGA